MSGHRSERPDIDTSAEVLLRRLDLELDGESAGLGQLVRTRPLLLATSAIAAGLFLVTAALFAPVVVAILGALVTIGGVLLATVVVDQDGVTGFARANHRLRRTARHIASRRRARRAARHGGSWVALWISAYQRTVRRR